VTHSVYAVTRTVTLAGVLEDLAVEREVGRSSARASDLVERYAGFHRACQGPRT
jgi:hypothetical protein